MNKVNNKNNHMAISKDGVAQITWQKDIISKYKECLCSNTGVDGIFYQRQFDKNELKLLNQVRDSFYNLEIELGVLGSIINFSSYNNNHGNLDLIFISISHKDFGFSLNSDIYRTMETMHENGESICELSLSEKLKSIYTIEYFNNNISHAYIHEFMDCIPTYKVEDTIKIFNSYKEKRLTFFVSEKAKSMLLSGCSSEEASTFLKDSLHEIDNGKVSTSKIITIAEASKRTIDFIEKITDPESNYVSSIPTGFNFIDKHVGGLPTGKVGVIAADSHMGKSKLLEQLFLNICLPTKASFAFQKTVEEKKQKAGLFFGLETDYFTICKNIMFSNKKIKKKIFEHKVDSDNLSEFSTEEQDNSYNHLLEEHLSLSSRKMFVCEDMELTVEEMVFRAKDIHRNTPLSIIGIDFVQLAKSSSNEERRYKELGKMSRVFMKFSKETGVPVVLLSQINQDSNRQGELPNRNSIRESKELTQNAEWILLIHREDINSDTYQGPNKDIALMIMDKFKGSRPCMDVVRFDGSGIGFMENDEKIPWDSNWKAERIKEQKKYSNFAGM